MPEVFKYGSILSVPLFGFVAFFLIRNVSDFSFHTHTISKSILFLQRHPHALIFRINFLIKALLDLSFSLYILQHFNIPLLSVIGFTLISSALLFGSLAYFIEGKHAFSHNVIVYTSGILWAVGMTAVTGLVSSSSFMYFTYFTILFPVLLGLFFLAKHKTNVFVQIFCVTLLYLWVIVFTIQYL